MVVAKSFVLIMALLQISSGMKKGIFCWEWMLCIIFHEAQSHKSLGSSPRS
jgi:hypothetical protein